MAAVGSAVKQMSAQQIAEYESSGSITLAGAVLTAGEIRVLYFLLMKQFASDINQIPNQPLMSGDT